MTTSNNNRESIIQVLTDNGLSGSGELHGWRCGYPERYGPCDCVATLADELAALASRPTQPTTVERGKLIAEAKAVDVAIATFGFKPSEATLLIRRLVAALESEVQGQ